MNRTLYTIFGLLALSVAGLQAQMAANIAGKYVDEKNKAVLAIEPAEKGYVVRQISTPVDKDKPMDGKVVAKITSLSGSTMTGVAISLPSGKEYSAAWEIESGGSRIAMRVKAGLFHFSANWRKCDAACS